MALLIGLLLLSATACQKKDPYAELFRLVEEHQAVFFLPRDEALTTLHLEAYEENEWQIKPAKEPTADQMKFWQVINLDPNKSIESYRLITHLPRSEKGYAQARSIVERFLDRYPASEEDKEQALASVRAIDHMTFPMEPTMMKSVGEKWSNSTRGTPLRISYLITNSPIEDEQLVFSLQFAPATPTGNQSLLP
jgi:hypothetical protein